MTVFDQMSGLWSMFWFKSFRKNFRKITIFCTFDHWSEILSLSAGRPISQDACPALRITYANFEFFMYILENLSVFFYYNCFLGTLFLIRLGDALSCSVYRQRIYKKQVERYAKVIVHNLTDCLHIQIWVLTFTKLPGTHSKLVKEILNERVGTPCKELVNRLKTFLLCYVMLFSLRSFDLSLTLGHFPMYSLILLSVQYYTSQ